MAKRSALEGWSTDERRALGSRIKSACGRIGTNREAAAVAGVHLSTIEAYVGGRASPSLIAVARLATAAGISLDWIATGRKAAKSDLVVSSSRSPGRPRGSYDRGIAERLGVVVGIIGTQSKAAAIAGTSETQLRRYLRARSRVPQMVITRLARASRVAGDWIITGRAGGALVSIKTNGSRRD